jgi:hypothetical protein
LHFFYVFFFDFLQIFNNYLQKKTEKIDVENQNPDQPVEPAVEEKDDDEKELEKLEKGDPEMIKVCNVIMNQLDDFKVKYLHFKN